MPLVNKVIYGNETIIDLTDATITGSSEADKILNGYTAYGADGSKVTGTSTFDVDSSSVTATQSEVLATKTFAKNGQILTGTMPNIGAQTGTISTVSQSVAIQAGYHDGSGSVEIASSEQAKVIPGNIKSGVTLLGVLGTYEGEGGTGQTKSVTPYTTAQTVLPDTGYDYLTQVNVAAITYTLTQNAAGGYTAQIGDVAPTI